MTDQPPIDVKDIEKTIHRSILITWNTAKPKQENARAASTVAAAAVAHLLQQYGSERGTEKGTMAQEMGVGSTVSDQPVEMLVAESHSGEWNAPTLKTINRFKQHEVISRRDWLGVLTMLENYMRQPERESDLLTAVERNAAENVIMKAIWPMQYHRPDDALLLVEATVAALLQHFDIRRRG